MTHSSISKLVIAIGCMAWGAWGQSPDGAAIYGRHCARCHDSDKTGWATRHQTLTQLPADAVLAQLHLGFMTMVASISDDEKRAVASFLAGKPAAEFKMPAMPPAQDLCPASSSAPADLLAGPRWIGWGVDAQNTRFQPAAMAGLRPDQIPQLRLKWAFAFPLTPVSWSQPVVAGGRVFVGSQNGSVYSLDARSGCTYWTYAASPAGVRSAINLGRRPGGGFAAYFGDIQATVHGVDAITGKLLWKTKVDDNPWARITGAVQIFENRIYVPVSSLEEGPAADPTYECCKFRGSLVALDAETGRQLWKTYVIPTAPKPTRKSPAGTQLWGPSGGGVWGSPTIDAKRRLIYIGTGDQYSDPLDGFSDSVVAIKLGSGKIAWGRRFQEGDRWTLGCLSSDKVGCPSGGAGPDFDFGSSIILRTLPGGREVLLAGQKSGVMHILDPDNHGATLHDIRLGHGSVLGGIVWGPASDASVVYTALSDLDFNNSEAGGGLTAIQIATGEKVWHAAAPKPACLGQRGCSAAQPAAVTAIPGAVFSGSLDGHLRAYASGDGKLLWDLDTRKPFGTVNGIPGVGGSINGAGPAIVDGMLFVNSGYGVLGGAPGNVLLAFSVDGR